MSKYLFSWHNLWSLGAAVVVFWNSQLESSVIKNKNDAGITYTGLQAKSLLKIYMVAFWSQRDQQDSR